ncbi:MFS transporter [Novosphingobium flavum]|uniref:MFS transporter n=1 Tax=Novosphingobium flavum TaxID=1778672 RepID=A0A7X1FTH5_9SPHN|nr:MFS transporter [Novosphingobium flavum]MBC2666691.1 MFS transporter [Novosphingobium flavum]
MDIIVKAAELSEGPMTGGERLMAVRLSAMMLVEFIVFGSWFATLGLVLATHGGESIIGKAYLLSAVAAIVSPLFMGAIGDRYLAPRNLMALLHAVGAVAIGAVPAALQAGEFGLTLGLIFLHMTFFQPTLGLVNSIALTQLDRHQRLFPYVRVFGPLGWVVAGLCVGGLGLSASTGVFYIAAGSAALLAVYSLTLPYSPPPSAGAHISLGDLVGVRALVLFRDRRFAVLMACTLLTSISLGFYNTFASPYIAALGISNVAGVLALGQISEVAFIVTIPWVLVRIGMKRALLLGMGMWGVRFALFILAAQGMPAMAVVGVALHGICNDYFIVIAAMFIARLATPELAAQAQGWLILMISGFGAAIGSALSGSIYGAFVAGDPAHGVAGWTPLWLLPMGLALLTSVIWTLLFPPGEEQSTATRTAL